MACQRPIVFAVGKNSQFCKRVSNETGCFVVDSNDAEGMAKAILEIKNQNIVVNTKEFFVQNMSRTKNSTRYAEIITGRIGK